MKFWAIFLAVLWTFSFCVAVLRSQNTARCAVFPKFNKFQRNMAALFYAIFQVFVSPYAPVPVETSISEFSKSQVVLKLFKRAKFKQFLKLLKLVFTLHTADL